MIIAEQKLNLFRQIDQLPEEALLELEKIVAQLKAAVFNKSVKQNGLGKLLDSWEDLDEDFPEIKDYPPIAEDFF